MIYRFAELIRSRCGLYFEPAKHAYLSEIVERQQKNRGLTAEQYFCEIEAGGKLWTSLVEQLTVKETYFFRELGHLELILQMVKTIRNAEPTRRIRILCAGCSTGEEPYSLAMLFDESFDPSWPNYIEILGADIDPVALESARSGHFRKSSLRNIKSDLVPKYFVPDQVNALQLKEHMLRKVTFKEINLLDADWPAQVGLVDFVLYRNVSIYFDEQTRIQVMSLIERVLNDQGVLVVGTTETLATHPQSLILLNRDGLYYFARVPNPRPKFTVPKTRRVELKCPPRVVQESPPIALNLPSKSLEQVQDLAQERRYDEALQLLENISETDQSPAHEVTKATILFQLGKLDEARECGQRLLVHDSYNGATHILLGMIAQHQGDHEFAVRSFHKSIFIQGSDWFPHFLLAEAFYRLGKHKAARREYRATLQHLDRSSADVTTYSLIPLSLTQSDVVRLCHHRLTGEHKEGQQRGI